MPRHVTNRAAVCVPLQRVLKQTTIPMTRIGFVSIFFLLLMEIVQYQAYAPLDSMIIDELWVGKDLEGSSQA
jgi:hypothetical protein